MIETHSLEILAVVCGLLNIYLAARVNILNWIFGILTVSFYFIIFLNAKLYAVMGLQLIFLVLQFYGWHQWLSHRQNQGNQPIKKTPRIIMLGNCFNIFVLFILISCILSRYTDSTTIYLDAFITAASLVAQWMMSKKWLEHWWLWMLVDIISIKMYLLKDLYFTSILYTILFVICVYGYLNWKKQITVPA